MTYVLRDNSTGGFLISWQTGPAGVVYNWGSENDAFEWQEPNPSFIESMGEAGVNCEFVGKNPKPR